jgi:hypothetical protein
MDLPHSDACFVQAYPAETTESFCAGHTAAFAFFGGVPQSILYDNTRIAVARVLGDGRRQRTDPSGFLWPTGQHPKWNLDRSQADWRVVDGNDRHESDTSASAAGMPFEALLSSVGSQRGDP